MVSAADFQKIKNAGRFLINNLVFEWQYPSFCFKIIEIIKIENGAADGFAARLKFPEKLS